MHTRRQFIAGMLGATGAAVLARAAAGPTPRWQIGCYTRPWMQYDYRVALDGIAAAGFKYAGLMTARSPRLVISVGTALEEAVAIGEEVTQRGLKLRSVYGGGFPVQESIDAGIAGLQRLIDNTAASGCPDLMLAGTANEQLQEPYYKVVSECCDYAAAKGVALSLKPHGGANATGAQCRGIIEQVGHPNFRLWYDPGNIFHYSNGELDPVDDVADVDGVVTGLCVKDYRHPRTVNITPGTGQVNFEEVLGRLKKGGFTRGPLLVECLDPGELAQINEEAVKTRRFLEQLIDTVTRRWTT